MRQTIDKIVTYILRFIPAITALVVPLFFLTITPDFFSLNKQFIVYVIATVALIAYVIRVLTRGKIHLTLSPSLLPVIGLIAVYIVSSIWLHSNPRLSLFGPAALVTSLGLIFITVSSSQKNSVTITSAIIGLITSATLLSLFAILQYFGLPGKLINSELVKNAFFTPSGNPFNSLVFILPIALGTLAFSFRSQNWLVKPLAFSTAVIMLIGSFLSVKALLPQNGQPGLLLLPYSTGWSIAVDTLKTVKTALVGTGPDNFTNTFTRLRPATLNLNPNLWNVKFANSSSEALNVLTVTGLLGLIFFLLFLLRPFLSLIKKGQSKPEPQSIFLSVAMIVALVSFLVVPLNVINYALLFILVTLITVQLKLENKIKVKDVQIGIFANEVSSTNLYHDLSDTPTQIQLPILPWLLALSAAVLLGVFWTRAANIYASAIAINQAALSIKSDPQKSYNKQLEAANLDPYNPYYKMNLSQSYLAIANSYLSKKDVTATEKQQAVDLANQAIDQAKAATALDPQNEQLWENFANISRQLASLQVQGSVDWALATYGQAIATDPTNPAIRVQLGTFYYLLGDNDMAIRILDQALDLKPDWDVIYYNEAAVYKAKKDYTRALAYMKEGLKYTDPKSPDITDIQNEIKDLEKLAPAPTTTPTPTPATKK